MKTSLFPHKLTYFTFFVAKGSFVPFLGLVLRARGCSLFMMALAMNMSFFARFLFSMFYDSDALSSSSSSSSSKTTTFLVSFKQFLRKYFSGSSSSSSLFFRISNFQHDNNNDDIDTHSHQHPFHHPEEIHFALIRLTLCISIFFALIFAFLSQHPLFSALVGGLLSSSLGLASIMVDGLVIDKMAKHNNTNGNNNQNENEKSEIIVEEQEQELEEDNNNNNSVDVNTAGGFGEIRLFGSIGWGIGSPLEVYVSSLVFGTDIAARYNHNTNSNNNNNSNNTNSGGSMTSVSMIFILFLIATILCLNEVEKVFLSCFLLEERNENDDDKNINNSNNSLLVEVEDDDNVELRDRKEIGDEEEKKEEIPTQEQEQNQNQEENQQEEETKNGISSPTTTTNNNNNDNNKNVLTIIKLLAPVLLMSTLYGICDDTTSTFLFPYLKEPPHNASTQLLSWIPTVNVLSELPVLHFSHFLHQKISILNFHRFALFVWTFRLSWYYFLKNPNYVFVAEVLNGLSFAVSFVLCLRHCVMICKLHQISVQHAVALVHTAYFAVAALFTGIVGGSIAQSVGSDKLFGGVSIFCGVVLIFLSLAVKKC